MPRVLLHQGHFPQSKIFPSSRTFPSSKDILFIKGASNKWRLFLHQGSFPQAKIFPSSRKFPTSKEFSFMEEVFFHKSRFFLPQENFPQTKIIPSPRKVSTRFPWSRTTCSTSKGFFMIMKVFSKQNLIFQAKIFHPYNTFIQYSKGISNEIPNKNPKH